MYGQSKFKYDLNVHTYLLENWTYYLGDCLNLWMHIFLQLTGYKDLIKSINNKDIQFAVKCNQDQFLFQDILIIKMTQTSNTKQQILNNFCHSPEAIQTHEEKYSS